MFLASAPMTTFPEPTTVKPPMTPEITVPHGGSSGSFFTVPDINLNGFNEAYSFTKNGLFTVLDVMRHTYLFGHFSILTLFIICLIFDLIFAAFFVTFNIFGGSSSSESETIHYNSDGEVTGGSTYVSRRKSPRATVGFRRGRK